MKAVDTTFLVDYLTEEGEGPVAEFLGRPKTCRCTLRRWC